MANQLKTKFIGNDQVKSEKILLENNSAIRAKDSSSATQDLLKLDGSNKVIAYRDGGAEEIAYLSDVNSGGTALQDHIDNPTDAHDASAISMVSYGNLTSTDVQAGLQELDDEKVAKAGDTMSGALLVETSSPYPAQAILNSGVVSLNIQDNVYNNYVYSDYGAGNFNIGSETLSGPYSQYFRMEYSTGKLSLIEGESAAMTPTLPEHASTKKYVDDAITGVGQDIQDHIDDVTSAHMASALGVVPTGNLGSSDVQSALQELQVDIDDINNSKGAANGLAPLNGSSKVDAIYLPSYVDDVEEYANLAAMPVSGESSKIYVALDTNKTYRWSGSTYIEISPSEVNSVNGETGIIILTTDDVGEGSVSLYFTNERARTAAVEDQILIGTTDKAPSQNAVYNALALKFDSADFNSSFSSQLSTKNTDDLAEGSMNLYFTELRAKTAAVNDTAYSAGWQGVTDVAPSKNAVYNEMQLAKGRLDSLEAVEWATPYKKTLIAGDITNGYIDLPHLAIQTNGMSVAADRLQLHQGASEDYTVSVVGGVTRITFLNDMVSPGSQQLSTGDNIYVRYQKNA